MGGRGLQRRLEIGGKYYVAKEIGGKYGNKIVFFERVPERW